MNSKTSWVNEKDGWIGQCSGDWITGVGEGVTDGFGEG